jgi:hypothetical protein
MNEPTTVATDFVLAALSLVLALRLLRSASPLPVARRLWAASFVGLALAAVVGGTWHAIPPGALSSLRQLLWLTTYTAIGLADLLMLLGATRAALPRGPAVAVLGLFVARFLTCVALVLTLRDSRYAAGDYLVTLVILFLFGLDLWRRDEPAFKGVLGGVAASCLGALVQYLRFSPHPQFDDNDLFHVIQMAAIWLFYRAGLLLRDNVATWGRRAGHSSVTEGTRPSGRKRMASGSSSRDASAVRSGLPGGTP